MKKNVVTRILTLAMAAVVTFTSIPATNVRAEDVVVTTDSTVSENSTETPAVTDEIVVYDDVDGVFAVGTDGVAYENVDYLTTEVFSTLDEENQAIYTEMCTQLGEKIVSGEMSDVIFAVDDEGTLYFEYSFASNYFAGSEAPKRNVEIVHAQFDSANAIVNDDNLALIDIDKYADDEEDAEDLFEEDIFDGRNSFDTHLDKDGAFTKNYFYNQISDNSRKAFKASLSAAKKGKNKFSYTAPLDADPHFSSVAATAAQLLTNDGLNAAIATYPQYFDWMDRNLEAYYTQQKHHVLTRIARGGNKYTLNCELKKYSGWSKALEKRAQKKVKEVVAAAYADALEKYPDKMTYGVVKYLNKWVCDNAEYAYDTLPESAWGTPEFFYAHTTYGCLLFNAGVCESYALTMSRLLDEAGIDNLYITGQVPGGGHAWNYVKMNDEQWYLLDATWNDGSRSNSYFLSPLDDRAGFAEQFLGSDNYGFRLPITSSTYYKPVSEMHDIYIPVGKSQTIVLSEAYADKKAKVKYWTDDKSVFTCSKKGKVKGKHAGDSTMTVQVGSAPAFKVNVHVFDVEDVTVNGVKKSSDSLYGLKQVKYTFKVNAPGAPAAIGTMAVKNMANFHIKSSKEEVAYIAGFEVSGNDVIVYVQPVKKGSTKISFEFGGKKATMKVKVDA